MSDFGLTREQIQLLQETLKKYFKQGKVIVYGSRAKGNFHQRSDIDLVIQESLSDHRHALENFKESIDESDFPYLCDVQYFESIKNPHLIEHIQRRGKLLLKIAST